MKLESPILNQLGGLLGSAAVRWWMGTLDYKVAYYDRTDRPGLSRLPGPEDLHLLARVHPLSALPARALQPGDAA